jgi:hypothetical protein
MDIRTKRLSSSLLTAGGGLKKWQIAYVIVAFLLAVVLVVSGMRMSNQPQQIWLEFAKAGLQLGILSVIGGGVAVALRKLESLREEQRALTEYRLRVLCDITTSYNQIKAARRILRAFGFRPSTPRQLSPDEVVEFRAQMKSLNQAQLAMESLKREVKVRANDFCNDQELYGALEKVEHYIGHVIKDWEDNGVSVVAGAKTAVVTSMENLHAFLGPHNFLGPHKESFEENAAKPMELLQCRIGLLLAKRSRERRLRLNEKHCQE